MKYLIEDDDISFFGHLKILNLKNENFTKSSYSMMIENFEYCSLLGQLNDEQRLIFDDLMHKKQSYLIHQYVFFYREC